SGAGNVISGNNTGDGILISGSGATGNVIQGNLIGTDASANAALPNGQGVTIEQGASNNLIGGTTPGAGNIIFGNLHEGVSIFTGTGPAPQGDAVLSNSILSNGALGIDLGHDGVTVNTPGGP